MIWHLKFNMLLIHQFYGRDILLALHCAVTVCQAYKQHHFSNKKFNHKELIRKLEDKYTYLQATNQTQNTL